MGKASKGKRQKESDDKLLLKDKLSEAETITTNKWSLFNKPIVHFFLIAIVGLLVYSNTFNVPFHFDDILNIVKNYRLKDLNTFWPPSGTRWLGFLTLALNYHLGGLNVTGYHIVNLAIHILNAILVYLLVVFTFRTPYFKVSVISASVSNQPNQFTLSTFKPLNYLPLFIALIFVAHPIQTQAVTYIVQRFTSLATMFYLLSLVMYIKWRESKGQRAEGKEQQAMSNEQRVKSYAPSSMLYAVSLFSAILAMKTKEISFTLPIIIVLYEFMFFQGKIKRRILFLMPIILTMLIIPLSIIGTDKPIGDAIGELREAAQETEEIPRWSYLFTQFRVIVTYIRLIFFPINQNLDYDYPIYHSFFNPEVFLSFLFLLTIFSFAVYLLYVKHYTLSASRFLSFGIFWFFITLSVESSIIPIRDVINEHRLYLPSLGIIIVFVLTTFYVLRLVIRAPLRSLTITCLLLTTIIIALSMAAYQRNAVWQDEMSLWEDVVRKSPQKAKGHYNLGIAYYNKGLTDMAIEHYQIALRLKPDYVKAHNNLGNAYKDKGMTDKAIEHYQVALKLNPDYAEAHMNMANDYDDKGMTDKAIEHYQIALRLKPDYAEAHYNLGVTYGRIGLLDKAIKEYQTALRLNPGHKLSENSLNRILQIQRSK